MRFGFTVLGIADVSVAPSFALPGVASMMALAGWAFGLRGLSLTVLVVAASLPVGANVFLFAYRYKKAEALVTATVAVSTLMAGAYRNFTWLDGLLGHEAQAVERLIEPVTLP